MFENSTVASGGMTPAAEAAGWLERLQTMAADCADDAARIDLLSVLEAIKGGCAGTQAALTADFDASQTAAGKAAKTKPDVVGRSVRGQVALARRDPMHAGGRHVGLARALTGELPHTYRALREGRISEWQATIVCRETACLDPELRGQADGLLADRLGGLGDAALAAAAARTVAGLDPAAVVARARKAVGDRRVTVRPAPDAMARLSALLPVSAAMACYASLDRYAALAIGEGDPQGHAQQGGPRGRGQIMADTLIERLTGGAITGFDPYGAPVGNPTAEPGTATAHTIEPGTAHHTTTTGTHSATGQATGTHSVTGQATGTHSVTGHATGTHSATGQATDRPAGAPARGDTGPEDAGTHDDTGPDCTAGAGAGGERAPHPRTGPVATDPASIRPALAGPGRAAAGGPAGLGSGVCVCCRGTGDYQFPTLAHAQSHWPQHTPDSVGIVLNVIMTDRTLLAGCDEPAELIGYGPIPADIARQLAAADLGPAAKTWLRRFYTDPDTSQLAAMDARTREFPDTLKQFLLVRDRHCRTPYCAAPGRDADHLHDHALGGPTSEPNGRLTCQACNQVKNSPGWQVQQRDDGTIETTTPTGHTYHSRPPQVPGVRHRTPPPTPETSWLEHELEKLLIEYTPARAGAG